MKYNTNIRVKTIKTALSKIRYVKENCISMEYLFEYEQKQD